MAIAVSPATESSEELPNEFSRLASLLLENVTWDSRRRMLTELRAMVHHAIISSLHVSVTGHWIFSLSRSFLKSEEWEKTREVLKGKIPYLPIGWITPDAHRVHQWFTSLATADLIGKIEWTGGDTCRYHYYLHKGHTTLLWQNSKASEDFNEQRPLGERMHYVILTRRKVHRSFVRERHTHYVVDAKTSRLEEWRGVVPRRVAHFLKGVPPWILPLLSITEGTIIREEVQHDSLIDQMVEEELRDIRKYSPAITLGPFVLAGWSSDDVSWKDRLLHRPFRGPQYITIEK